MSLSLFEKLQEEIRTETRKDITSAEQFILKEFCSNYITVRFSNKFILDVSDPILTCINHFECEEPKSMKDLMFSEIFW